MSSGTSLIEFRVPVARVEAFSDALWALLGIQGIEEGPDSGGSLFSIHRDFEILEFGSEAAKKAADWLQKESYRGRGWLRLKVYVEDSELEAALAKVSSFTAKFGVELTGSGKIENTDYLENYKASVKGVSPAPGLWIGPPWQKPEAPMPHTFFVEPGLAFGTGDHPTTQLCLTRLMELSREREMNRVLDLGTGSGILGAGLRHFFPSAQLVLTDIDPVCRAEVEKTFSLNGMSLDGLGLRFGPEAAVDRVRADGERFDFVVSNIYAEVLAGLVNDIAAILPSGGGWLASGILEGPPEDQLRHAAQDLFHCELRRTQLVNNSKLDGVNGLSASDEVWVLLEFRRR